MAASDEIETVLKALRAVQRMRDFQGLADNELSVDVYPHLDPLGKLGYDPRKLQAMKDSWSILGMYTQPWADRKNVRPDNLKFVEHQQGGKGYPIPADRMFYKADRDSEAAVTIAHESRHRGLRMLRDAKVREAEDMFSAEEEKFVDDIDYKRSPTSLRDILQLAARREYLKRYPALRTPKQAYPVPEKPVPEPSMLDKLSTFFKKILK